LKIDGAAIKSIRTITQQRQHEMAAQLGVSRSLIAMIETGKRKVPTELEEKIRTTFAQQLDKLVERVTFCIDGRTTTAKVLTRGKKELLFTFSNDLSHEEMLQLIPALIKFNKSKGAKK
jgi:transcriptional regulator with XRE-family HTH domain